VYENTPDLFDVAARVRAGRTAGILCRMAGLSDVLSTAMHRVSLYLCIKAAQSSNMLVIFALRHAAGTGRQLGSLRPLDSRVKWGAWLGGALHPLKPPFCPILGQMHASPASQLATTVSEALT